MRRLRILLLRGGTSNEYDVSLHSGRMVVRALDVKRYSVTIVTISKDGRWIFRNSKHKFFPGAALKKIESAKFDVAFIALHGSFGEDGGIQSMLDAIGLPYTGSGPETSALAMNKNISNILFERAGLDVPPFIHILGQSDLSGVERLSYPIVVKPCHGGSSMDVVIANDFDSTYRSVEKILNKGDSVIVQKYIKGRELTCGILDNESRQPVPLPPTEIIPIKSSFFDFKSKYKAGASREITPPHIASNKIKELQRLALIAHRILGCQGMSRSDFIFSKGIFYILETNTIPGMTATSLLPQEAQAAGISFSEMLDHIINSALSARRRLRD